MLLYKDLFTEKDILTDSYPMKLIDDFVYEVEANYQTKQGDNFELEGANPSAEDAADDLESAAAKCGFNILLNHSEDIEEFQEELKYKKFMKIVGKICKAAEQRLTPDRLKIFKPKMQEFFKEGKGKTNFDNFQCFFSVNPICEDKDSKFYGEILACPILVDADNTGMKATVYYFKDLMIEEKM